MNKHILSLALIISTVSIAAQKEFPAHLKNQCNTKPTKSYTCRDLTPEEVAQSNERRKEQQKKDKVEIIVGLAFEWYGVQGLQKFASMSDQEIVNLYDQITENICARLEKRS